MLVHERMLVPRDRSVGCFCKEWRWVEAVVQVGLVATSVFVLLVDASCVLALVLGICVMVVGGEWLLS